MENKEEILKETSIPEDLDKNSSLGSPSLGSNSIAINLKTIAEQIFESGEFSEKIKNLEEAKKNLENKLEKIENRVKQFEKKEKKEKKYLFKIHAILLISNIFLIILAVYSYFMIFDKVLNSIFSIIEKGNILGSIQNNWLKLLILLVFLIVPSVLTKDIFLGLPQFYKDLKNMLENEE